METLSIIFGALVGLSLGLTGGGGAIFAVPLLVYGLSVAPREAVVISLASVGATSFVGFLHRWRLGEVEHQTGLLFALAGMTGAPLGAWCATLIPDAVLLTLFGGLMVVVAVRLWQQAAQPHLPITDCPPAGCHTSAICQRDASGALLLTSHCALILLSAGVMTGVLSGLFGVGGGFVIVPALVLFSGMQIHRAVGTSLMVIALVSLSGIFFQFAAGHRVPPQLTLLFVAGGIAGLFIGQQIGRRLSGPALQKTFAIAILAVAVFVIARNFAT